MVIVVSVALKFAVDFGFAPPGSVYADPSLPRVLPILSAVVLIDGFASTKAAQSRRNIRLARVTQMGLVGQLAGVCCMLAWVCFDRSIWALVIGALGSAFTKTVLSHIWLEGERNRLQWDHSAFREIFKFGKWIFFSSILGFLVASGDRLILGGLIDSTALGVYSVAFTLASALESVVTALASAVAFPALSEIARDRAHDLQRTYYRFHGPLALLCYFCSGVLVCAGQDLINILYDHRYADAGWMLQVLAMGAISFPFQVAIQVFLALGVPNIHSRILLIRLLGLACGVPLGFFWFGLPGALWGIVASELIPLVGTFAWLKRLNLLNVKNEVMLFGAMPLGLLGGWLFSVAVVSVR
jgi:O-antigen/teichoic acid export membrane protein